MVKRSGNFGFVEDGAGGLYSFSINARNGRGWTPASYAYGGASGSLGYKYMTVLGEKIIPYGPDNNMPGQVCELLEKFYAGEGIMGKKVGLQWGEGPRLYRDAVEEEGNRFYRAWIVDEKISEALRNTDYLTQMHRCLVDLCHLEGFWVKFTRARGSRIGAPGKIARVEHIPAGKVRFIWNGEGVPPTHVMVADWPLASVQNNQIYPIFNPADPFKHTVSVAYFSIYSYNHDFYSFPRFLGAFGWLELAGTLAPLLSTYNENASAISKHIESPASYWEKQEQHMKEQCQLSGTPYTEDLLEKFKDEAMEVFASQMSGKGNAGKFLHTSQFWNAEARAFEGWKITPIDNKVKEYIEAQVAICKKAEAAATSGFGLDPSLSNLILDTKLGSGSEKLYALKVYNATETTIPDMVLCKPFQQFIDANFPGTDVKIGLYRSVVEAEKNVNPENRVKANA